MSVRRRHEYGIQGPDGVVASTISPDLKLVHEWLDALDLDFPDRRFGMVARTVIESEWVPMTRIPPVPGS